MKRFMIRNKRHKEGDFEKGLVYGKTYWFGWRGASYSQTFTLAKGKTITLVDNDGEKHVVSKRWLQNLFNKDEWCLQFLVEIEPE